MRKIFLQNIVLLLFLLKFLAAHGADPILERQELISYLINDFDVVNQTWSISQNPENHLIYLANSQGLIEYNGIIWKNHILEDNLPVRAVSVHSSGDIFTGSFEEFGYWRYNETGELIYYSLTDLTSIEKNDEIWKIYFSGDKVFFQSFTSVYIYDFKVIDKVLAPYTMLFMHLVEDTFVAQIIDEGLFLFRDKEFVFIENSEIFTDKKVHAIIPWDDSGWLICTDNNGLYRFDGTGFRYFDSEASGFLESFTCNAAKKLNDSTFVFGSILNGIIITDKQGNIQRSQNTGNGLQNNTVLSFFADADKGLWIGLDEGINYIDLLSPSTHYKSRYGTLGTIYALLKHDDRLYIGTNHGLFMADIVRGGLIFDFENLGFIPGSHGQVWTLENFDDQIICGHNNGTFLVKDRQLHEISSVTGGWTMMPLGGNIVGGTYTGIIILEKDIDGYWQFRNKVDNFSEPTRHIEIDYLGYIWASHHQKGIFKIEISDDLTEAVGVEYIQDIFGKSFNIKVFKINNRVVFTTKEDIYTFDFVRNEIVPFEALTEHLGEFKTVNQISHHQNNEYWFIKDDKLALFEIGIDFTPHKKYEILHENINLPQRNIQLVSLDDSMVIIPNPHSFDLYNLSYLKEWGDISKLQVDRMFFYGDKDSIIYFDSFDDIRAPWNINNLTVSFADPSLFDQISKRFQFRIKELDPAWQYTSQNQVTYLDLNHGQYTLEIRRYPESIIEIPFSIGKPWYSSYAALIIYALILMVIAWVLLKFFRYEIRRHKEMIDMELKHSSLEKELDYRSYELMLTMRHLLLKDKILKDLQQQITAIKEESSKYPVKYIKNMERIINQGLGTQSVEWEHAMKNLKLSQQGFFKALKDKYPQLTPHDLRLCSYLRMNFNTKEIALLMNVTTRGVEIGRHRIRKKLKLKTNDILFEFLMREEFEEVKES